MNAIGNAQLATVHPGFVFVGDINKLSPVGHDTRRYIDIPAFARLLRSRGRA
jgi:hypothetical protein